MSMKQFSGSSDGSKNLLEIMREKGWRIHADCGGRGTCGKCRVRFISDAPEPLDIEKERLSAKALREGVRLACQTRVCGDFTVEIDDTDDAMEIASIEIASIEESDISEMPQNPVVAMDIGTTTLAAALLDPDRKKIIKAVTGVNHQRSFGADVISRIQAANQGKGDELKELIRSDIKELVSSFGVDESIPEIISANTTMQHLWQGLSCETLGVAPYTPVDISCRTVDGCTLLPGISTYVGADIVSGIVAVGMDQSEKPCVLIDLGTNGEMAIGNKDRIMVASTAAGPAFEGGNISCGTAGIPGAVSSITIDEGTVKYETIGDQAPVGLCGTGVIEIVYELLKEGLIDDTGFLDEDIDENGFRIAEQVLFTQKDIREVQLAKAAIRAGFETILQAYGIDYDQIGTVYLAGGFGLKINLEKACGIGLLPEELLERTYAVGNTSLKGAVQFAFDQGGIRDRFIKVASSSEEVSLADSSVFQEEYMDRMYF
nr:ASKHA domain-containing protein [Butyrivibrio sp. WCD3002]